MQSVHPVKHSRTPRYPVREEALVCPGLLERLPERWRKSKQAAVAAGLLAAMASAASGCDKSAQTPMLAGTPAPTPIMTEEDVCQDILIDARAWLPGLSASYTLTDGDKPVTFVTCVDPGSGAAYEILNTDENTVDLFDASSGVGFEYIAGSDYYEKNILNTGNNISKADKDHSYILVFPHDEYYTTDEASAKADIQKKVKDFIEWLKAEDVI